MDALSSLRREEAIERAELLEVERYDIDVDMTGLADGDTWRATSVITFSCARPGATTFVDCAAEVVSATLNGDPVDPSAVADARIRLSDLAERNVLEVVSVQRNTAQATSVHRAVDPADGNVYVWSSFEPDDARRAWACFDQPDLKAPFGFTVTAPASWTVVSNSGDSAVEERGDAKRWTFPDTPPLSTYVPVLNAGPFHEVRRQRDGFDLALFSRQSLSEFLDRDADELFDLTATGLGFFGEKFGMPFGQASYDQVFVPEMGGAMENYGCVTYSDSLLFRSAASPQQRAVLAEVVLHEMAHMWFGDLVTMQWWDDLWLNEAFATWASMWASAEATEFTDAWAGFLAGDKLNAYPVDRGPTSHPIRRPAPDVAVATAGFDAITYVKGASVLKQLFAYVGEEAFLAGLRQHFATNAWRNATLADLMRSLGEASGRDLSAWTRGWLDTAGTDVLTLQRDDSGLALHATGPDGADPRPHRLDVGAYAKSEGRLVLRDRVDVEITGERTPLPAVEPDADVLLVNDSDLTWAVARPDAESVRTLLDAAGDLPTSTARAVAVAAVWDLLMSGTVGADDFVSCVNSVLVNETAEPVVEPFLSLAVQAALFWSPDKSRDDLASSVADTCLTLAGHGGARRMVALRTLARTATTDAQLRALDDAVGDDVDLGWRRLVRIASLNRFDSTAVEALRERDPDPDSWVRALAVECAQPQADAKDTAWQAVVEKHSVPIGSLREVAEAFWQPAQAEVVAPYADRYLAALPGLSASGMIVAMSTAATMFPLVGTDDAFVDRVVELVKRPEVSPVVEGRVLEEADLLKRMLNARR